MEKASTSSTPASTPVSRAQADSSRSSEALPPKVLAAELKRRTSTDINGMGEKKRKLSESSQSVARVKREALSSSSEDEAAPKRPVAGAGLALKGPLPKPANREPGPPPGGARPIANGGPARMAPPVAPRPVPPMAPTQPPRAPRPAEDVLFIKKKKVCSLVTRASMMTDRLETDSTTWSLVAGHSPANSRLKEMPTSSAPRITLRTCVVLDHCPALYHPPQHDRSIQQHPTPHIIHA
jgi:hypothetical protein